MKEFLEDVSQILGYKKLCKRNFPFFITFSMANYWAQQLCLSWEDFCLPVMQIDFCVVIDIVVRASSLSFIRSHINMLGENNTDFFHFLITLIVFIAVQPRQVSTLYWASDFPAVPRRSCPCSEVQRQFNILCLLQKDTWHLFPVGMFQSSLFWQRYKVVLLGGSQMGKQISS